MKEVKKDVFLGSGLPSLIMALYMAKNYPEKDVLIIEREEKLGGTNGSISYDNGEVFDYGMKVYYECGIEQLDSIVENSLPKNDIFIYSDNEKDRAGCYFNGKIQKNSTCLDLRYLESEERVQALGEILTSNLYIDKLEYNSCENYLLDKFGKTICQTSFFPILERLHKKPISELDIDASSLHFGSEERVILFDEDITKDLMKSDILRKRLAYPEQENLPKEYSKRLGRAIYPKKMGIKHLVKGLKTQLLNAGVEIAVKSQLDSINYIDNKINSITSTNLVNNTTTEYAIENLYWNSALPILANKLGYSNKLNFDIADKTYLAHFVFNKQTNIDHLYHIFNYDEKFTSFRIVNYNGYCPTSSLDQKFRVTVEFWPHKREMEVNDIFQELVTMKVIDEDAKVLFGTKEILSNDFPLPTIMNKESIRKLRDFISKKKISNLVLFGQTVEDNVFFIPDIMKHAFKVFNKHNLIT